MKLFSSVLLLLCSVLTFHQAVTWSTVEGVWTQAVSVSPLDPGPHLALGMAYQDRMEFEPALEQYAIALGLDRSSDPTSRVAIGLNVSQILVAKHREPEALQLLDSVEQLARANPGIMGGHNNYPDFISAAVLMKADILTKDGIPCPSVRVIAHISLPCD